MVVNCSAVLGDNIDLCQFTTIGSVCLHGAHIGNNVYIGPGVCIVEGVTIGDGVTSIGSYAFYSCYSVAYYDFTSHTSVPTLSNTNAFNGISADCEIRVPASLAEEWKTATNWATYADYIVGV